MNVTDRYRRQVETSKTDKQTYQSGRVQEKRKSPQTEYDQVKKDLEASKLEIVKQIAEETKTPVSSSTDLRNMLFIHFL